jgi:CRP-like cAMP-binding protein
MFNPIAKLRVLQEMSTMSKTNLKTLPIDILNTHLSKGISLTAGEFTSFASLLKMRSLKKGEFLLRKGEVCKHETFITQGCVKSYYEDEQGLEHILDFCIEGWWADDLYSFFTQQPAESSIKAIEDTEVLQINRRDLEIVYETIPKFERYFRLLFQRAYISQREQINAMLSVPAEERYRQFTKKKPYAEGRFSQKDIASYLGVTPQFLSAMKRKLR